MSRCITKSISSNEAARSIKAPYVSGPQAITASKNYFQGIMMSQPLRSPHC